MYTFLALGIRMKDFQDFLSESLDKPYEFTINDKTPAYVFGQYEFEHGGHTLAVRFQNGTAYGKRVSIIRFGRKTAKSVSKKLPVMGNMRPVLATVVSIIKYHIENVDHPVGKSKLMGFALEVDADDYQQLIEPIQIIVRRLFKKWKIFGQISTAMTDPESYKTVYMTRRGKKFRQVFSKVEGTYIDPEITDDIKATMAATSSASLTATYDDDMNNDEPPELGPDDIDMGLDDEEEITQSDADEILAMFMSPPDVEVPGNKYPIGYYTDTYGNVYYIVPKSGSSYKVFVRDPDSGALDELSFNTSDIDALNLTILPIGVKGIQMNVANHNNVVAYQLVGSDDIHLFSGTQIGKLAVDNFTLEVMGVTPQNEKNEYPFSDHKIPFAIKVDAETGEIKSLLNAGLSSLEALNSVILDLDGSNKGFLLQPTKTVLKNMVTGLHEVYVNAEEEVKDQIQNFLYSPSQPKQPDTDAKEFDDKIKLGLSSDDAPKQEPDYRGYPEDFTFKKHSVYDLEGSEDLRFERFGVDPDRTIELGYGISFDLKASLTDIQKIFIGFQNLSDAKGSKVKKLLHSYIAEKESGAEYVIQDLFNLQQKNEQLSISSSGADAISMYTGSAYTEINNRLRGTYASSNADKFIENMDKAFQESGLILPKGLTVYRGESRSDQEISDIRSGNEIFSHSYSSTSLKTTIANNFLKVSSDIGSTMGFVDYGVSVDEDYKRNKLLMSIDGLENIPVLVPGSYSNFKSEAEIILPRGTKFVLASDELYERLPRVYMGHFTVTGIQGLSTLFESKIFKSFRMFCEQTTDVELKVKTMLFDMMAMDFIEDDYVKSTEELQAMEEYFMRMASES